MVLGVELELGCAEVVVLEVALLLSLCAVASGSVLGGGGVGLALLGVPGVFWLVLAELFGVAEFMLLFVVSAGAVVVDVPIWPALWSVEFVVDAGWADWSVVVVGCCVD